MEQDNIEIEIKVIEGDIPQYTNAQEKPMDLDEKDFLVKNAKKNIEIKNDNTGTD